MVDSGSKEPVSLSLGLIHPTTQARNSRGGEGIRSQYALQLLPAGSPAAGRTGSCAASLPTPRRWLSRSVVVRPQVPLQWPPSQLGQKPAWNPVLPCGVLPRRALIPTCHPHVPKFRALVVRHLATRPVRLWPCQRRSPRSQRSAGQLTQCICASCPRSLRVFPLKVAHAPWNV